MKLLFSASNKTLAFFHRRHLTGVPVSYISFSSAATGARDGRSRIMAEEKTAEASKKLVSVPEFLKTHGFDDALIGKLVSWYPRWLSLDAEKAFAPKLRAFRDLGISGSDIARIVERNPVALKLNIEIIVGKFRFWHGVLGSHDELVKALKNKWLLQYSLDRRIRPNLELLQSCGIADKNIKWIARNNPMILTRRSGVLKALVGRVEGLGMPRTAGMFHRALYVLNSAGPENVESKLLLFQGFGWSEADFCTAFRVAPFFLALSRADLQKKMEFFVEEVGCAPSYIAIHPGLLTYSLEKRLIPRHRFLAELKSRQLLKRDYSLGTIMLLVERKFLEKFVYCYKEECPDLVELYIGSLRHKATLQS